MSLCAVLGFAASRALGRADPVGQRSSTFAVSHIAAYANGTIHFRVSVPRRGAIDVLETTSKANLVTAARLQAGPGRFVFARAHVVASHAGGWRVTVAPGPRGALLVRHHRYRVTLNLWVSYVPAGGKARSIDVFGLRLPPGCSGSSCGACSRGGCAAGPVSAYVCTRHVTAADFASVFSSALQGAVLCLAPGYYGAFHGAVKSSPGVVITADVSAGGDQGNVVFGPVTYAGSSGITLDDVTVAGVRVRGAAHDLTVSHAVFTDFTTISDVQNANILFAHDRFAWGAYCGTSGHNSLFFLNYTGAHSSGVTVQNSVFANSDCDGVHTGTALNVLNNTFYNLCDVGTNHTDNIQFEGAVGGRIAGNFIHEPLAGCVSQGITSYGGGTYGVTIEDNVIDTARPWGIEFYADVNSIIRHNTVPYRVGACAYRLNCGGIDIDCKHGAGCPRAAGYGTQVYDNIARISVEGGASVARIDHNYNGPRIRYAGGSSPPSNGFAGFADYRLDPRSVGKNGADDGTNLGITDPP